MIDFKMSESEEIEMSRLSREEGDQEMETANERMMKRVSKEMQEMSALPREEGNQEIESTNVSKDTEEMSPPREEDDQERETETANERMADNDHDQEKNIKNYYESLEGKSFFETLQFQKENFFELPASDENVHPLTLEKRTSTDMIIALALFFMR